MANPKEPVVESRAAELLRQREKAGAFSPLRPLEHLAFAILTEHGGNPETNLAILSRIRQDFVDWNEVRVARIPELARLMRPVDDPEQCARRVKDEYNAFFDKKGALSFEFLAGLKPPEARKHLQQLLPSLRKGAIAQLLFAFCPGAVAPLSDAALALARKDGVIGKSADRPQLAKALLEGLTPEEAGLLLQHWEMQAGGNPYGEVEKAKTQQKGGKTDKAGKRKPAKDDRPAARKG